MGRALHSQVPHQDRAHQHCKEHRRCCAQRRPAKLDRATWGAGQQSLAARRCQVASHLWQPGPRGPPDA
eukprot:8765668-Lingulodinium_polyedra.AAC.1